MLSVWLVLSVLLTASSAPDWSYYSRASSIHAQAIERASRSGAWMRHEWAAQPLPPADNLDSTSDSADKPAAATPPPLTDVLVMTLESPLVLGEVDPVLPVTVSGNLLRALLAADEASSFPSTATTATDGSSSSSSVDDSESSVDESGPLRVLLNFGEHGREIISSEIALRLLEYMDLVAAIAAETPKPVVIEDPGGNISEDVGDGEEDQAAPVEVPPPPPPPPVSPLFLSFLLSHVSLKVVPLLNVWSHKRVEDGFLCERKSRHGVDLNRNWDYLWNGEGDPAVESATAAADPIQRLRRAKSQAQAVRDEQYPGPHAFSEVESRVLRDLATDFRPDLYINYHSGIREIYCGWDHRAALVPNEAEVTRLMRDMNRRCQCAIGGAGAIGGYLVHGGSMDYVYDKLKAAYSLTVEVYGGDNIRPSDCFAYFNPTTREALDATTHDWTRMTVEALHFLVREKRGLTFPYRLDSWMNQDLDADDDANDATKQSTTAANAALAPPPLSRNYYSTIREMHARFDGDSDTDEASNSSLMLVHPPMIFTPFLTPVRGGPKQPSWNDACTPFFDALPPSLLRTMNEPSRLRRGLPVFATREQEEEEEENEDDDSKKKMTTHSLNVLVIGGATWNDLFSTEIVCSWMTHATSAVEGARFYFIPSLFSSGRSEVLESPLIHASFCSALLGADSKTRLLAHQLYATQHLLRVVHHRIRPHVIIEVAAEEYVPPPPPPSSSPPTAPPPGTPVPPPPAPESNEFMHVEATWLRDDTNENADAHLRQARHLLRDITAAAAHHQAGVTSQEPAAPTADAADDSTTPPPPPPLQPPQLDPNRIGFTVRTREDALAAASVGAVPRRCEIGHVDVERLLLPLSSTQPAQCPSCRLFIKLFAHGRVVDDATTQGATSPPTTNFEDDLPDGDIEALEAAVLQADLDKLKSRASLDSKAPSTYAIRAPAASTSTVATDTAALPFSSRSVRLYRSRSDEVRRARLIAATGNASSSSFSSSPFGCDFAWRNLRPHDASHVLARHLDLQGRVWQAVEASLSRWSTKILQAHVQDARVVTSAPPRVPFLRIAAEEVVTNDPSAPFFSLLANKKRQHRRRRRGPSLRGGLVTSTLNDAWLTRHYYLASTLLLVGAAIALGLACVRARRRTRVTPLSRRTQLALAYETLAPSVTLTGTGDGHSRRSSSSQLLPSDGKKARAKM